jgi:superfamily II DNA/RNA helicase
MPAPLKPSARARASSFSDLGVPPAFVELLERSDITHPMPIQALSIPDVLAGRDVACCAPTGSGKTLAFALPMAATLRRGRARHPSGLVLAPTRELATQIAAQLSVFARSRGLKVQAVFGGVGYGPQLTALRRGVDVLVACPGRLEDLIGRGEVRLDDVAMVVIDEADRMADMGFLPAVRRILDATPDDRQTLLFSATLDGDVDVLVRGYQRQPTRHDVADEVDSARVTHTFHYVAHDERVASCARIVSQSSSTIVFVRTRHGADRLVRQLSKFGVGAAAIHGDRSQGQRERALLAFRSGSVRALVATDVAARGIHVDDVACVVHFDLPEDAKGYVHRSGRTARAGAEGAIVSLVTPEHHQAARELKADLRLSPVLEGAVPTEVRRARPEAAPARSGERSSRSGSHGRRRRGPAATTRARS